MAETTQFDPLFPETLTGEVMSIVIKDKDDTPNHVLQLGDDWSVEVGWHLYGHNVAAIGGTWYVDVLLELMGPPNFEAKVGSCNKNLTAFDPTLSSPGHRHYKCVINIPANTPPQAGLYRLVSLITYRNDAGQIMEMAGFRDGPLVHFFQPE